MKMGWIAAIAVAASAALASAESMTFNFTLVPVSASGEGNNPENLGGTVPPTGWIHPDDVKKGGGAAPSPETEGM